MTWMNCLWLMDTHWFLKLSCLDAASIAIDTAAYQKGALPRFKITTAPLFQSISLMIFWLSANYVHKCMNYRLQDICCEELHLRLVHRSRPRVIFCGINGVIFSFQKLKKVGITLIRVLCQAMCRTSHAAFFQNSKLFATL